MVQKKSVLFEEMIGLEPMLEELVLPQQKDLIKVIMIFALNQKLTETDTEAECALQDLLPN